MGRYLRIRALALLIFISLLSPGTSVPAPISEITIDGDFSDWEGVPGVTDEIGDISKPGTDIVEFKFAHDESHLYAFSRHAGPIESEDAGKGGQGRLYLIVMMDVDRSQDTGWIPGRDDPGCYVGIFIGNDFEWQIEMDWNDSKNAYDMQKVYGYGGAGTLAENEQDLLDGVVDVGPTQGRYDDKAQYKIIGPNIPDDIRITYDLKNPLHDPNENVMMDYAFSDDRTMVEMSTDFRAFLRNSSGEQNIRLGIAIDVAMACESSPWNPCGDGSPTIFNYVLEGTTGLEGSSWGRLKSLYR